MSDDDLIRRGDVTAILAAHGVQFGPTSGAYHEVSALPAAPLDAMTLERAAAVCDRVIREFLARGWGTVAAETCRDAIRALAPEPAHVTAARVVKIKPLEWEAVEQDRGDGSSDLTGDWLSHTQFGSYSIVVGFGSGYYVFDLYFGEMDLISSHDDPELAKAAAQANYETRIRSAIEGADHD